MSENFTYLGAANITSKQKTDMAKVAIKNENITSFGGIYHIMDVFSKLALKDKEDRGQTDIFGVIYTYRCILTNNWMSTEKDIITFYNEREASEKSFDIQDNDFG